jgi:3-hydroxyacyl-[acyl-carrier-protein] dehydratase
VLKGSAEIIHEGSGFAVTKGELRIGNDLIAECEMTMMIMDFPSARFKQELEKRAERIGMIALVGA